LCGQGKVTEDSTRLYDSEFNSILNEVNALKDFMNPKVPENKEPENKEG